MVWALTKGNHERSCDPFIRWWLGTTIVPRFLVSAIAAAIVGVVVVWLIAATTPNSFGLGGRGSSPLMFLAFLPLLVLLFPVIDTLWDFFATHSELKALASRRDVVLATRAEYIGGHPKLPRGRFLYLLLEGSLQNPKATLLLPAAGYQESQLFPMPVLEVEKTKSTLAKVFTQNTLLGKRLSFTVEYSGESGRKHEVELTHFFYGSYEVQTWRNFIVCIQAEADTSQPPYGLWKSLPKLPVHDVDSMAALTAGRA